MKEELLGKLIDKISHDIEFSEISLSEEYFNNALFLSIIDAASQIGVNWQSVQNTGRRYCN